MIIAGMINGKFRQFLRTVCVQGRTCGTDECAVNEGTGGQAEHLAKNKGRNHLNTETDYAMRRSWLPRGARLTRPGWQSP
jgi:hypothetical protein